MTKELKEKIKLFNLAEKYSKGLPPAERSADRTTGFYDCLCRVQPLIKALYSAKETLGLAVLLDKSDTMQNEINEIEKALQDYNKK